MSIAGTDARAPAARGRPASPLARWLAAAASRSAAVALAGAVAWLVGDLPFARTAVAVVLVFCAALQLRFPASWLVFLPALLPVADLSLWSGRLYVSEFDLLVLSVAAAHFWEAPAGERMPALDGKGGILACLLVLSFLPGLWIGASPLPPPSPDAFADYFSRYNALRVAKGFLWALLLLPALRRQLRIDETRAVRLFVVGVALGLALTGLVVLWERGVMAAFLTGDRYAVLGALLNFTVEYRATALFSELHTGGEAIDTYLVLAASVVTGGAFALDRPALRALCLAALGLGLYALVATLSRGLYVGYAAALTLILVLLGVATWRRDRRWRGAIVGAVIGLPLSLAALAASYQFGGYTALAIGMALGGAGMLLAHLAARRPWWMTVAGLALLGAAAAPPLIRAFISSRYNATDAATAAAVAAACCAAIALSAAMLGGRGVGPAYRWPAALGFVAFAIVAGIGVPVAGGYSMVERFAEAGTDFGTRRAHWAEALRLADGGWADALFGVGMGSFPRKYFLDGAGPETRASYRYGRDANGAWLEIGSADFNMTQKVPLEPHRRYELALDLRAVQGPARLTVKLCPKLILFGDRWTPNCRQFDFRSDRLGQWVRQDAAFDSGALGEGWPLTWPVTILLCNESDRATLEVTNLRIAEAGAGSGNLVENGDFARGGDRWILISDFQHLAWHIKDLYVELYYETGVLGALTFLICIGFGLTFKIRQVFRGGAIAAAFVGALTGFCVVGVVGSLVDNPRPAFLFFLLLFWSLHRSRQRPAIS